MYVFHPSFLLFLYIYLLLVFLSTTISFHRTRNWHFIILPRLSLHKSTVTIILSYYVQGMRFLRLPIPPWYNRTLALVVLDELPSVFFSFQAVPVPLPLYWSGGVAQGMGTPFAPFPTSHHFAHPLGAIPIAGVIGTTPTTLIPTSLEPGIAPTHEDNEIITEVRQYIMELFQ